MAPGPPCSHPRWNLGGTSASDGTLVGMPEKHLNWNLLSWALIQALLLSLLNWWLPVCGTGSLCGIPGIPAGTCSSLEKWGTTGRETVWAGINSLGGGEGVDRGLGLEKGVWEEAARTKEMSSGGKSRGAEVRWSTCSHGMETPSAQTPCPSCMWVVKCTPVKLLFKEGTPSRCKAGKYWSKGHSCSPIPSNNAVPQMWFFHGFLLLSCIRWTVLR